MSGFDDEDDDFGDFQEAQFEDKPEVEPETEWPESSTNVEELSDVNIVESSSVELNLLGDLLTNHNFWDIDTTISDDDNEGSLDENLFDLFSYFDGAFLSTEDTLLADNAQQAIEIWQFLRVVEETNALKFRWPSSQLYSYFIKALSFYGSQQQVDSKGYAPKASFLANGEFTVNSGIDDTLIASCSNEAVLSSEWTSQDYSGTNNTLDCDFFQADSQSTNGPSLLEKELSSLGLGFSGASKNQTPKHTPKPVVNGTTNHNKSKPLYLSVSELNEEAQLFYQRMPNLNFMLSVDRVIRDH